MILSHTITLWYCHKNALKTSGISFRQLAFKPKKEIVKQSLELKTQSFMKVLGIG